MPTEENTPSKSAFRSKLIWLSTIMFFVCALTWWKGTPMIADNPDLVAIIGMLIAILIFVFRYLTKVPLKAWRKRKPK